MSVSLLRGRWTGLAGTFAALCLGAAILTASALLLTSAGPRVPARYAAVPLLVRGPGVPGEENGFAENPPWSPGTTEALVRALASVPGVAAVLPYRSAPGPYGADGVRVIGLRTEPGADLSAVRAAAGRAVRDAGAGAARVLAGEDRAEAEPAADARTRWIGMQVLTAMALLGGFVSVFVVASTFAFRVVQRRREFGLLRVAGATSRQVRLIVYGEALTVGVVAAVAGALLGAAVAPAVGGVLVTAGFEPASFDVRITPLPLAGAVAAGIAAGLLGAWSASGRAARVRPLEALRDHTAGGTPMTRLRWITGVASVAGGLALAAASASAREDALVNDVLVAAMALIIGLTLLSPVTLPPLVRAFAWPVSRSAVGMLAGRNALAAVRRTAATAAPVLLTVGFTVLVTGMVRTTAAAYAMGSAAAGQAEEDRLVWLFTLLLVGVSAGYSGLAIVNTQVMAASARVREFAVLRLSGATRRQVIAATAAEAVLVTGIGTTLGFAVAVPALLGMRAGLSQKAGAAVPLVIPWPAVAGVVIACLVLAAGAATLFTYGAISPPRPRFPRSGKAARGAGKGMAKHRP
ncbi:ABC transporter permease [Microbispora cellulosiformans]|uniref:ABC transporter permease n=1 Tax=Microbispora cellulosiformans TaxID=2614688 RepID=A0A5J5K0V2_9ACTN|nr:ABC transporter permease [Microbispora cellulosiformans]